jgi:hypothetical protein
MQEVAQDTILNDNNVYTFITGSGKTFFVAILEMLQ